MTCDLDRPSYNFMYKTAVSRRRKYTVLCAIMRSAKCKDSRGRCTHKTDNVYIRQRAGRKNKELKVQLGRVTLRSDDVLSRFRANTTYVIEKPDEIIHYASKPLIWNRSVRGLKQDLRRYERHLGKRCSCYTVDDPCYYHMLVAQNCTERRCPDRGSHRVMRERYDSCERERKQERSETRRTGLRSDDMLDRIDVEKTYLPEAKGTIYFVRKPAVWDYTLRGIKESMRGYELHKNKRCRCFVTNTHTKCPWFPEDGACRDAEIWHDFTRRRTQMLKRVLDYKEMINKSAS